MNRIEEAVMEADSFKNLIKFLEITPILDLAKSYLKVEAVMPKKDNYVKGLVDKIGCLNLKENLEESDKQRNIGYNQAISDITLILTKKLEGLDKSSLNINTINWIKEWLWN